MCGHCGPFLLFPNKKSRLGESIEMLFFGKGGALKQIQDWTHGIPMALDGVVQGREELFKAVDCLYVGRPREAEEFRFPCCFHSL